MAKLPGHGRAPPRFSPARRDEDQRRSGRLPGVGLDRERGADQRGSGATHRGDARHQRMAVGNDREARRVVDTIVFAGQTHTRFAAPGKARQRCVVGFATDSAPNSARFNRSAPGFLQRAPWRSRARRRAVDEHRVEHPGDIGLVGCADGSERRLLPFGFEGARLISSASARAAKALTSFWAMVIDGTAPTASSMLAVKACATALGDAMHPRPALAQALQMSAVVAGKSLCGARISPSAA